MDQKVPMEFKDREILIIYKPKEKKDTNTYVLAKQLSEHIREIDVFKDKITPTQLKEVLDKLGVGVEELIEKDSDSFRQDYHDKELDEIGWLNVLVQNPDLLKTPIVFLGKKGVIIQTPSNVLSLDPEHSSKRMDK